MKSAFLATAILATIAVPALAQHKPEQVIHYRQSAMTLIGWNFGALSAMVKGKTTWDAKEFAMRADRLASLAPQVLEGFAPGSDKGAKTEAKPGIWTNFDDFKSKDSNLVDQTKALADVAHTGDEAAMKAQFKKTAQACKDCHDKYKED
ncbi:MAG: cytochrome c [Xanthomonadales bacterium PRO7]|nr:cytochrome c [Xanthomonadales bacterium PRO7]